VRRVLYESEGGAMSEREGRCFGRPSKVEAWKPLVEDRLKQEPELPTVELMRLAKEAGYGGRKSAFFDMVAGLRPVRVARPMGHVEWFPGEATQHDFGEVTVRWVDGGSSKIDFFVSRLMWSQMSAVTIVVDHTSETLCRCLVDDLAVFGGVPHMSIFDNDPAVCRRRKRRVYFAKAFRDVAAQLQIVAEMCWPFSPEQKGSVENLVKWVKNSFFKVRRFHDLDDLKAQLAQWLDEVNTTRPSRATNVIPAERLREESCRLRPLAVQPAELALRIAVVVNPMGFVVHANCRYSMPAKAISVSGTLYLFRGRVRIIAGVHRAEHPRLTKPGQVSTLPEHRAEMVNAVCGKRGKLYYKRQALLDLGPPLYEYLSELVFTQPKTWPSHVEEIFILLEQHGEDPIRAAVQIALNREVYSAKALHAILVRAAKSPGKTHLPGPAVHRPKRRSGCSPALPCPPLEHTDPRSSYCDEASTISVLAPPCAKLQGVRGTEFPDGAHDSKEVCL
jgi:transposase